jgi:hypothetical protein
MSHRGARGNRGNAVLTNLGYSPAGRHTPIESILALKHFPRHFPPLEWRRQDARIDIMATRKSRCTSRTSLGTDVATARLIYG